MVKASYLTEYILNTSFHGFRYIAEPDRHWTERIFWTICCILSWIASAFLMMASWDDFKNNAISFVIETNYLEWNTNFPSVIVCENENLEKIMKVTDELYGDPHDYNLDEVLKEIVYYKGLFFYIDQVCSGNISVQNNICKSKNFTAFTHLVRSNCEKLLNRCKWNKNEFDCCKYFVPIDTELGVCYGINSKQAQSGNAPRYQMISNKKSGPGSLYLEILLHAKVYILDEQEIPSLSTLPTDYIQVSPRVHYHRFIAIEEIENQPEVKDVSIEQRKCRFIFENNLDVYRHYSYSACLVQCRKKKQNEVCTCNHHYIPNTKPEEQCDINGLKCLNRNYYNIAVLRASWANRTGLVCDCLPSCTEMELSVVRDNKKGIQDDFAALELSLDRLPSERFKRNVVHGKLDLVVSMGGATALFLGASILSFVELVYYFALRPFNICNKRDGKE